MDIAKEVERGNFVHSFKIIHPIKVCLTGRTEDVCTILFDGRISKEEEEGDSKGT